MHRIVLAIVLFGAAAHADSYAGSSASEPKCKQPEYRQLDFWVGDWDTFESDHSAPGSIARAKVDHIAGSCAIHELYVQTDGLIGDSILSYDPIRKQWQQTWLNNYGGIMQLYGEMKDGTLTLEGETHQPNGKVTKQKIHWKAEADGVREWATWSLDGGKTWKPYFDVLFKKHVEEKAAN